MAPKVQQHRYPKRKRAAVNYEIDQSIDGGLDLEDDGNISEELGEDSSASANSTSAQQTDATITFETDSEFEDATFGSRRTKKRKVVAKAKAKLQPKAKRPPKFKPFRLMDLPPELRLKVYEEALVDPYGVNIRAYSDKYQSVAVHVRGTVHPGLSWLHPFSYVRGKWTAVPRDELPRKKYQLSPNLLAASKTVHDEAVSLLWTQPFIFNRVVTLHTFLLMLRPETISRLRDITILSGGWNSSKCLPAFVLLRDAPLLRNLRLDCRIRSEVRVWGRVPSEADVGKRLAENLYKDCYPFLQTLVQQQGAESILSVIKFSSDEFEQRYLDTSTSSNTWVRKNWSKSQKDKIMEIFTTELNTIMSRKIVPRIPRGHI